MDVDPSRPLRISAEDTILRGMQCYKATRGVQTSDTPCAHDVVNGSRGVGMRRAAAIDASARKVVNFGNSPGECVRERVDQTSDIAASAGTHRADHALDLGISSLHLRRH